MKVLCGGVSERVGNNICGGYVFREFWVKGEVFWKFVSVMICLMVWLKFKYMYMWGFNVRLEFYFLYM